MSNHQKDLAHLRRRVAQLGGPDAVAEFTLILDALHQLALDNKPRAHQEELAAIAHLISARETHHDALEELGGRVRQLEADVAAIGRALREASGG